MSLYKIVVTEETIFTTYIQASSKEEAEEIGEKIYQDNPDEFSILENSHETQVYFIKD